MFKMTK